MAVDIGFESVAALIYKLGNPPRSTSSSTRTVPPEAIFTAWLNHHARPFPPGTGKRLFRLLFPHEGSRRRYGLRETRLATELEDVLAIPGLTRWDAVGSSGVEGAGCLGHVVQSALTRRETGIKSGLTLARVDALLDELAASSTFSQLSQRSQEAKSSHDPLAVLHTLYRDSGLSPCAAGALTQIILRDLRPLLAPPPRAHPALQLRTTVTASPAYLTLPAAMKVWDPRMVRAYRAGLGCLDACADAAETGEVHCGPVLGVNVDIPKCFKGRSIADALKWFFVGSTPKCAALHAETKYDGYRMQIHVEVGRLGAETRITIFSKSKRNSTVERGNTHAIILSALGLPVPCRTPQHPTLPRRASSARRPATSVQRSVILEAEVLAWNEGGREGGRGAGIEEFWWLAPAGVTVGENEDDAQRHLCLAFFDILHLDGESLLDKQYAFRRRMLRQVVRDIQGFSFLAKTATISLTPGRINAEQELRRVFQKCCDQREEGLVLKADTSTYNDTKLRWVKLKKDYIPNLGDCVDLVVLGAGWDIERARELRVDTSVYTTFYIGTLTNADLVSRDRLPHFEILFRVSYGMDRTQLELYNQNIRLERWRGKPFDRDDPWKRRLLGHTYTYAMPKTMVPPSVLFEQPLCAEVMGAGFQKLPGSSLYELRWPRLQKIFDKTERPWIQALRAPALRIAAHEALGYTDPPSSSLEEDSLRALWRTKSSAAAVDIVDLSLTPRKSQRYASAPGLLSSPMTVKAEPSSPLRCPLNAVRARKLELELEGPDVLDTPTPARRMAPISSHALPRERLDMPPRAPHTPTKGSPKRSPKDDTKRSPKGRQPPSSPRSSPKRQRIAPSSKDTPLPALRFTANSTSNSNCPPVIVPKCTTTATTATTTPATNRSRTPSRPVLSLSTPRKPLSLRSRIKRAQLILKSA